MGVVLSRSGKHMRGVGALFMNGKYGRTAGKVQAHFPSGTSMIRYAMNLREPSIGEIDQAMT